MNIHRTPLLAAMTSLAALAATAPSLAQDAPVLDAIVSPAPTESALAASRPVPLAAEHTGLFDAAKTHQMPRLPVEFHLAEDLLAQQDGETRMRTGIVQPALLDAAIDGTWSRLDDGRHVWTIEVHAPDSVGLRLRLERWQPIDGGEIIVYAPDDFTTAQGPITSEHHAVGRSLWTPTIWDDTIRLEYVLPKGVADAPAEAPLRIDGVLNCYNGPNGPPQAVGGTPTPGTALSCHLDWRCFSSWDNEGDGVALYHFVDDGFGGFICSGAMLNRGPADFTPIFMTAWHCGVRDANVQSMEVYWGFHRASCGGAIPNVATLQRSWGVAILVNDPSTDWTLVGLDRDVGGTNFLGWDANYLANGSSTASIHHPRGSWKRITFHTKNGDGTSCIPGDAFFGSQTQGNGEIEPGSSGSPLFDSSRRVRGTTSCATWGCGGTDGVSHGRFDNAFPNLEPFLLPPDVQVYVDNSWGGAERGTDAQPFSTFLKGVFSVREGDTVIIDGGTYSGATTISKPMTLTSNGGSVTID